MPHTVTESDKRRLTEHLINTVVAGITGRDNEDLVELPPHRSLFGGVLQPIRSAEQSASTSGATTVTPSKNSLGIDFRIIPHGGSEPPPIMLGITLSWAHYYPVFPTFEQARRSNSLDVSPDVSVEMRPSSGEDLPVADPSGSANPADLDEAVDSTKSSRTRLPRVFRRVVVRPPKLTVTIDPAVAGKTNTGAEEIAEAIGLAQAAAESDAGSWRHLGPPEDGERALGTPQVLRSTQAYSEALAAVAGAVVQPPNWAAALQIDTRSDPSVTNALRVQVLLTNSTPERATTLADIGLEERSIFDATMSIEILGAQLVPFDFVLAPQDYRVNPQMAAKGVNCSVLDSRDGSVVTLKTDSTPIFAQPMYRTRDDFRVEFETLSTNPLPTLKLLADSMQEYGGQWDRFLASTATATLDEEQIVACRADRGRFELEFKKFQLGLEALSRDGDLTLAFRLMNRVFDRIGRASPKPITAWRLFQIGFIISQMPSLAVRTAGTESGDYGAALNAAFETVDVLWFPTGGGKTEAYLGLLAVALLYDRLRGKARGVTAWLRFPLRMLSLQQLERLARVIAGLDVLRSEEPRVSTGDPFSIGYYVGRANTPNTLTDDDVRRYEADAFAREQARLLRRCPFCGSAVEIKTLRNSWRLAHVCVQPDCFSNTSATLGPFKGSLPLCVVDTEIYRYLPSVLVGTVDKLAIAGYSRFFSHITGGVTQACPVHGYTSLDECIERWGAGCKVKGRALTKLAPTRDPGPAFLIQDELHLLRAELGVFNGHYEGLLRHLCAPLPPKVLAATATIEAYDVHAFHVYLARATRYPQPSWVQGESFYATSKPALNRRFYVGIPAHTRGVEDCAIRILSLYWREIRRLEKEPGLIAGIIGRATSEEESRSILRLYDFSLGYVTRKATAGTLIDRLPQVERFLAMEGLPAITGRTLTGDHTIEEIGATLDRIERELGHTDGARLNVVLATNLISHGVDLERINMMTVCGMPSHYAEYIQSTSRSARSHPGAIFVCFRTRDPRENSQFEFFRPFHENIDRLVEAVAVNRFASFAPRKTVPGLLAAVLMSDLTPRLYASSKVDRSLDNIKTLQIALGMKPSSSGTNSGCVDPAYLLSTLERIIGVDRVRSPASDAQVANVKARVREVFADNLAAIGRTLENRLADVVRPLTSFRDVDEGVDFGSVDSASLIPRLKGR